MKYPFLILLLFFASHSSAQSGHSKNTKINFTEAWVWEYTNPSGNTGEMALYREPKSNYWLLTAEAYGDTDDMCDWILVQPNGTYYIAGKDAEPGGGSSLIKVTQAINRVKAIPAYWKATARFRNFGNPSMGFADLKGREFLVSYTKTNESSIIYLAKTTAAFAALSVFNDLDTDAKLPVRFPKDIPDNYVALSDTTKRAEYNFSYRFKYISHTEYHIDLKAYQLKP